MKRLKFMIALIKGKRKIMWAFSMSLNGMQTLIVSLIFGFAFKIALDSLTLENLSSYESTIFIIIIGGAYLIFVLPIIGYIMEIRSSSFKYYIMDSVFRTYVQGCDIKSQGHSAEAMDYLQNDVRMASDIFGWDMAVIIQALISGVGSLVIMAVYSYKIALMCLCFGGIIFLLSFLSRKMIKHNVVIRRDLWQSILKRIIDIINNHRTLKIYGLGKYERSKISELTYMHEQKSLSIDNISNCVGVLVSLFSDMLMYSGVIIVGTLLINLGEMTFGTLMLFLQLCTCVIFLFTAITDYFVNYQDMLNAIDRLVSFYEKYNSGITEYEYRDNIKYDDWKTLDSFQLTCEINEFAYEEIPVLNNVSFELKSKEVCNIIGKNGSGKSTLAKILANQLVTKKGDIVFNGVSIQEIPPQKLPLLIGLVPQTIDFIRGTLIDNIELGFNHYDNLLLNKLIQITELDKVISQMPQGMQTIIEPKGNNLSSGQKQRVALVRSLIRKPLIIILDEFDANIENSLYNKIISEIRVIFPQISIIMINHKETRLECGKEVKLC